MLQALYYVKQKLNGFLVMKGLRRKRVKQLLPEFVWLQEQICPKSGAGCWPAR